MRQRRLKRKSGFAVALVAAVATLFVLAMGWMETTRHARRKVQDTVARAAKRAGVDVAIGRWRLGVTGASFEDVVIEGGAAVIDHVSARVSLNPFSDAFGELEEIEVRRLRLKTGVDRALSNMETLDADFASLDVEAKAAAAAQALEKLFRTLPVQRLLLKSGGVQVVDAAGQSLLAVRGLKALVDKRQMRAMFQIASLRTASGVTDQLLQGRVELAPKTGDWRFFVRRKLAAETKANAWHVSGRVRKDLARVDLEWDLKRMPSVLAPALAPIFGGEPRVGLSGRVAAAREGASWRFDGKLVSNGTRIAAPLLSSGPVGPLAFEATARGSVRPQERTVVLDDATLEAPVRRPAAKGDQPVRFALNGALRFPATLPPPPPPQPAVEASVDTSVVPAPEKAPPPTGLAAWIAAASARLTVTLQPTLCQALLDAAPPGLLPALAGFKLDGLAAGAIDLSYEGDSQGSGPAGLGVHVGDAAFACKVLAAPYVYTAEHLAGPFTLQREVGKGDEPLEINVNPRSPGFTPLGQISKTLGAAFVTSEDASFWLHRGIDVSALEGALRKNLSEGRVAVGGSTITMQTVKNLFLTQERTVSRKLQEIFLAWHLENILEKDRILEIYANIVEYGPGIYGITQASEHFFGKHPFDLSVFESAYLASLLPSPKRRYEHFCAGKMSQAFNDMVHVLMKKMVNLSRVPYDRYAQSLSEGLHFNDAARRASHECARRSTIASGDDGDGRRTRK